jgi:hypothetical protein
MPAFRGKNLRSGDLAEELGILLLQNVALVAPIPRTEDVGIDAVATLIQEYDGYKYIAEDSFLVQIKSTSVSEITFKNGAVKWLSELELPFFIATVDRKTSTINLFSTHYLSDVLVENPHREEITLDLKDSSTYDCCNKNKSVKVPVGPCIISWSLEVLETNKNFSNEFYDLLKSHITMSKKSIETRRVGVVELTSWETGKKPIVIGTKIKSGKGSQEVDEVIAPYFNSLLFNLILEKDFFTIRSLYRLFEKVLEQEGHFTKVDGIRKLIPFKANLEK